MPFTTTKSSSVCKFKVFDDFETQPRPRQDATIKKKNALVVVSASQLNIRNNTK